MHNIATVNGVQTFAGERPGWHMLGKDVGHAMTSREAIEAAGLSGWNLQAVPVYVQLEGDDGGSNLLTVPGRRAILRGLDNAILGTVGDRYQILHNEEAFEVTDGLLQDGVMTYSAAGALGIGERVWLLARIGEAFEPREGDRVFPYLLFTSAHDGSGSALAKLTFTRVVCENTLNIALGGIGQVVRVRHTATVKSRLEEGYKLFGLVSKQSKRIAEVFKVMAETKATDEIKEKVVNILAPMPAEASESVEDKIRRERLHLWRLLNGATPAVQLADPETVWGVFNAATEWIDWLEPRKGMDQNSANAPGTDPWYLRRLLYSSEGQGEDRRQAVFKALSPALAI